MYYKKLNFYYFGEVGIYDIYSPAYVCNKEYTSEILYLIAKNEPFTITKFEIAKLLNIEKEVVDSAIYNLEIINAIENKNSAYRIKFPVFLETDVVIMKEYINNIVDTIGNAIIEMQEILYKIVSELECSKKYSYERLLYHVICDQVFDGFALDFLAERNTICISKFQPGKRNYIIVAYEDSNLVEEHSNRLLCSSNNFNSAGFTFNSFGDSNGSRNDVYRFFRKIQESVCNASPLKEVNISYNKILNNINKEILNECGLLLCNVINNNILYNELSEKEKRLADFLYELEYIQINAENTISINVPFFYEHEKSTVIKEVSNIILAKIFPIIKNIFNNIKVNNLQLTSIRHGVDIKDIANEMWHQIFGFTNEYLANQGFVETPANIDGQGRYLKSLIILKH